MRTRAFGATGLTVPALGLGAGPLGDGRLSDAESERLVHAALDLGVCLFDTARSYGASEERLGRALAGLRGRAILSTKVGYGIDGVPDWTEEAVTRGIAEALSKLRTDYLDVVHLHSCPREVLSRGDVVRALRRAVEAGHVRVAAYSGEDDALDAAVLSGAFGSVELSVSPWDQGSIDRILWRAKERSQGVIAKRPLANAFWREPSRPLRPDVATYWDRARALSLPDFGLSLEALSLRFAVFTWGVDCAIAGTTSATHLRELADIVAEGPLPADIVETIRGAFRARGLTWGGVI